MGHELMKEAYLIMKKQIAVITGSCFILLFLLFTSTSFGQQELDKFIAPEFTPPEIDNAECMECHSDKSLERDESTGMKADLFIDEYKFNFSIHNVVGVGCVSCHSDIGELDWDSDIPHGVSLPVNCDNCHKNEGEAYVDSVHKKAGGKGITIPCYACHGYHFITHLEADSVEERENGFCLKCHNPNKYHDWLPQKDTHFAFVECTVCHAMEAPRHINLRLYDLYQEKFLNGAELLAALNTDYDGFMALVDTNGDNEIDLVEFENLVLLLRENNVRATFHGELVVEIVPLVHHVNRGKANRDCEQCHMPTSPFFKDVRFSLNKENGTTQHHMVTREVLSTYYVNHFYALGGTRVRLLDQIGMAIVAGGLGVVVCHLMARIVTAPARRRRKEKEGKSK
jgi:hypothetical protein